MGAVQRLDGEDESRPMINAIPEPILQREVPGFPLFILPAHHAEKPFYKAMKSHDVWGVPTGTEYPPREAVNKPYRGVQIHDGISVPVLPDVAGNAQRESQISKTAFHFSFRQQIFIKKIFNTMSATFQLPAEIVNNGSHTAFMSSRNSGGH
jgi:hypothetical protein